MRPTVHHDSARLLSAGRFLPYALVFAVALALRLAGISVQNLWYDEHWTLRVALAPISQLLHLMVAEEGSKPPLYFAFMHYWVWLGTGEFWLRLPSAIFGSCDAVVAAAVGRHLFGAVGMRLGWLIVLSPFHIYYSQEARPYALWGLFVTTALLFHLKYCAAPQSRFLIGYIVAALLACYTFTYSFFLFLFSVLFTWLYRPALSPRDRIRMAFANGIVLLLYVPWLWTVLVAVQEGIGFIPLQRGPVYAAAAYAVFTLGLGISAGPSLEMLRSLGLSIFEREPLSGASLIFGFMLLAVLLASGGYALWQRHRSAFYFSGLGVVVFLGTAAFLNVANPEVPLNPRYVSPAVLPLMILILAGCGAAVAGGRWRRWLAVAFFLTVGTSLGNHYLNPAYARDDLRGAAEFLRAHDPPPEKVLICGSYLDHVFNHYFGQKVPVEGVSGPLRTEVAEGMKSVDEKLAGVRRFALVYSRPDHGDRHRLLPSLLQARYHLSQHRHWTGVDVYVFEVPSQPAQP